MERVWVKRKGSSGDPVRFPLVDGRLALTRIAETWNLKPSTICVGPDAIRVDADGLSLETISEIRDLASTTSSGDGMSKESAFIVDGCAQNGGSPDAKVLDEIVQGQRVLTEGQRVLTEGQRVLRKGQTSLQVAVRKLEQGMCASLWLTLWGEIVSTPTSETTELFRKDLVAFYGDAVDNVNVRGAEMPLRCMVTDLRLPGKWITAAHLLGRRHSMKGHVFGINDIDDPRNGMLWNRAIEEKFSSFQIVFSWSQDENTFITHILDKDLIKEKVSGVKLRKPFNRSLDIFMDDGTKQKFEGMTFGDLEGQRIKFNSLNRPFKRVLCAHAKLGIWKVTQEGTLAPGLDLGKYNFDYWSDSADSKVLQTFLVDSQAWIAGRENKDGKGNEDENEEDDSVDFDLEGISNPSDSQKTSA